MSLSTPTRTTLSEISACAALQVTHVAANATTQFKPFIVIPPLDGAIPDVAGRDR
jgi:hypothetical protein